MAGVARRKLSVMVVDDDLLIRVSMSKQLIASGYHSIAVESPQQGLLELAKEPWDVVLSDLRMPKMTGIEFMAEIRKQFPGVEVILMTAYASIESAVDALKLGAYDYITKPFRFEEVEVRLRRIDDKLKCEAEVLGLRELISENVETMGLIGNSTVMQRVRQQIQSFAESSVPLLVTGETGTGKEVVARAIHGQGRLKGSPFIAVGCGTIPRDIAESELFGHEKGAFSGAQGRHIGAFERAHGGVLLLDDIDDLPLDLQVKLLRVIQEGKFHRVGGEKEIAVDVRLIATTKVDLEAEADEGRFRPDLFYRLRGLEIHLPALRARDGDLPLLAQHFLKRIAARERGPAKTLSPAALEVLQRYTWRGNVRELERAVEAATVMCQTDEVAVGDLPDFVGSSSKSSAPFSLSLDQYEDVSMPELIQRLEGELLDWALLRAQGKQTIAAKLLGIPRTTLQSKLQERSRRS